LRGEKRKEGGKKVSPVTNCANTYHTRHLKNKDRAVLAMTCRKGVFGCWMVLHAEPKGHKCLLHTPTIFFCIFLYYVNTKLPLNRLDNNKKNHCENMKKLLEVLFNFFASRVFWSFQFIFLYLIKYQSVSQLT
jgi:hypothetical protein